LTFFTECGIYLYMKRVIAFRSAVQPEKTIVSNRQLHFKSEVGSFMFIYSYILNR
jgi:hypothetical protein